MTNSDEIWAWAHSDDDSLKASVDASAVAGILVVHRASRWLARTLVALSRLDHRPGRLVAVLNDTEDEQCRSLLDKAVGEGLLDEVLDGSAGQTPGAAWTKAAQTMDESVQWLWLLHDDVEPRRDAFDALCRAAAADPRPDIVFPKLLEPIRRNYPDRLAEVGQTIATTGGRVVSVEPGDLDQAQLTSERVLGGSTAGMFVRREAFETLGGFESAIPLHRDGLELSWRANLAGMRVVTAPEAALHHRQAGRRGERESELELSPELTDRLMGMRLVAAHSANPGRTNLRLVLFGLLGALGLLLAKSPTQAREAWRASTTFWKTRNQVDVLRSRAQEAGSNDVSDLLPPRGALLLTGLDRAAGALSDRFRSEEDEDTSLDDLTGDEFSGGRSRIHALRPVPTGLFLLVVAALAAGRRMVGVGDLVGPQLLPAPGSLTAAWDAWLRPQPGVDGSQTPWLFWQALGSTLTVGRPAWWALVQQAMAVPVATATALPLANQLVRGERQGRRRRTPWVVVLVATCWGLTLGLTGITGRGSLGSMLLSVVLPLIGWVWLHWWQHSPGGAERWRDPAMFTLLLVVAASVNPAALLPGLVAAALAARRRSHWTPMAVVVLGPLAMLAPWLPRLADDPARLVTTADPLAVVDPARWPVLALFGGAVPTAGAAWPVVLVAGMALWAAALVAVDARRSRIILLALSTGCLVVAAWLPRQHLRLDSLPVRPDADLWQLLGLGGLLCLSAGALRDLASRAKTLVSLLSVFAVVSCGWWVLGSDHQVRLGGSQLPAHVQAVQKSGRATRALMVDLTGAGSSWQLSSSTYPQWGSGERQVLPEPLMTSAEQLAAQLAAGSPSDELAPRAAALGIGHLWVKGADADQVATLSNSQGLGPAETVDGATTWTVTGLVSPVRIVTEDDPVGKPVPTEVVPEGGDGRTLVLAAAADHRWRATLDGEPLHADEPVDGQQAFALPAKGGVLEYQMAPRRVWIVWQALVALVLVVLAAPAVSSENVVVPRRLAEDEKPTRSRRRKRG